MLLIQNATHKLFNPYSIISMRFPKYEQKRNGVLQHDMRDGVGKRKAMCRHTSQRNGH